MGGHGTREEDCLSVIRIVQTYLNFDPVLYLIFVLFLGSLRRCAQFNDKSHLTDKLFSLAISSISYYAARVTLLQPEYSK